MFLTLSSNKDSRTIPEASVEVTAEGGERIPSQQSYGLLVSRSLYWSSGDLFFFPVENCPLTVAVTSKPHHVSVYYHCEQVSSESLSTSDQETTSRESIYHMTRVPER